MPDFGRDVDIGTPIEGDTSTVDLTWDEALSGHATAGTAGKQLSDVALDSTVAKTTELISGAAVDFGAVAKTSIQTAADAALTADNLNHLLLLDGATSKYPEQCVADSVIAKIIAKGDPATPSTYDCTTDSLEALSDAIALDAKTAEVETTTLAAGAGSAATTTRLGLLVRWIVDALNTASTGLVAVVAGLTTKLAKPTANANTDATISEVVGIKADDAVTTVGTVASIIAYIKGLLNNLALVKAQTDKLTGAAAVSGSTTANYNTVGGGTSAEGGADVCTIGVDATIQEIRTLRIKISALTAGAAVTIRLYWVTDTDCFYRETFLVGTDPASICVVNGPFDNMGEAIRVEAYSNVSESKAIGYKYRLRTM